jgi:hypothetical protein
LRARCDGDHENALCEPPSEGGLTDAAALDVDCERRGAGEASRCRAEARSACPAPHPRARKMSTEDKPEKPREEKSAEWHRARAKRLRANGFTKMAEEHEQIAADDRARAAAAYEIGRPPTEEAALLSTGLQLLPVFDSIFSGSAAVRRLRPQSSSASGRRQSPRPRR